MHVIASAFGSYGDVLPMIGIGAAMRDRGHRVELIANPHFRPEAEAAGIQLLPLGTVEEYQRIAHHPDLWHPRRGLRLVLNTTAAYLRHTYNLVESRYQPGETVLAAHGLDLASRIFHDKHSAPLATVHYAPFAFQTVHDTPQFMGVPVASMPRSIKKAIYWSASRWIVDPCIAPAANALRTDLGLDPARHLFNGWHHSPERVIAMFPDWFAASQPDWPPQTRQAGFPLWDAHPEEILADDVQEFLDSGDPPVVFAPGSANVQAAAFFRTAAEVCRRLGRRGILATKYEEQLPSPLPPGVRSFGYVPFSQLLPRAAALVHHGGIGTCAQGLASGTPHVIMPLAFDQLDNGSRLERLGVGRVVSLRQFKPPRVAAALDALLQSPAVAARTKELAARCDGHAARGIAADYLEGLLAGRLSAATM